MRRLFILAAATVFPVVVYAQPLYAPPSILPSTAAGNVGGGTGGLGAITTGTGNAVLGTSAGSKLTSGSNNLLLGNGVASTTLATGNGNILLGTASNCDLTAAQVDIFKICSNTGATYIMQSVLTAGGGNTFLAGGGGDIFIGTGAGLGTTNVKGFFHFPFTGGVPTGVPTNTTAACLVNTATVTLNCYNGTQWYHVTLTAGGG